VGAWYGGLRSEECGVTSLDAFGPGRVYDLAAEAYAKVQSELFSAVAERAAGLVNPQSGARVLDVATGNGGLALAAADRVGPSGEVIGVDISEEMLGVARRRAAGLNLDWVQFRHGDMDALPFRPRRFDAVMCGFGLFFSRDQIAAMEGFWDLLKPGGRLGIVALGDGFFRKIFDVYLYYARRVTDEVDRLMRWQWIARPEVLEEICFAAGVRDAVIGTENHEIAVHGIETWDLIVAGTGISRIDEELGEAGRRQVRDAVAAWIKRHEVTRIHLGAIYVTATKPAA